MKNINWFAAMIATIWICCAIVAIAVKNVEVMSLAFWITVIAGIGYVLSSK